MLRAWLKARMDSESDAEDVLQEALMRVLNVEDLLAIRSPKSFLFATARNLILMKKRRMKVRKEVALEDFDRMQYFSDESHNVSEDVTKNEELEILTKAIQSLPTRCRQILTLRKLYGMSQKQIASELGISENTVESQGVIGMQKITHYFAQLRALKTIRK